MQAIVPSGSPLGKHTCPLPPSSHTRALFFLSPSGAGGPE